LREDEIGKLLTAPEPLLDTIIFVGDGLVGQVWWKKLIEEEGVKYWLIQFEPEDLLFKNLQQDTKAFNFLIDKKTGKTITRKYIASLVQIVGDQAWARRILVFTDFLGTSFDLKNIERSIVEENERLEKENRSLRNQNGWLWDKLKKSQSGIDEDLREWSERFVTAARVRWDVEKTLPQSQQPSQASYMAEQEGMN